MQIDEIMTPSQRKAFTPIEAELFIDHDDFIEEALSLMVENQVTTLPVLGPEGDILGSVSYLDVLRALPESTKTNAGGCRASNQTGPTQTLRP